MTNPQVLSNSAFLIHINQDTIPVLLRKLLEVGVDFEFLKPELLGNQWQSIQPVAFGFNPVIDFSSKIDLISKIIHRFDDCNSYQKQPKNDINKVLEQWSEQELIEIAYKLSKSNQIILKQLQTKGILQNGKLMILDQFKALLTRWQIDIKISQLQNNFWVIKPGSMAIFGLMMVNHNQLNDTESILQDLGISYQEHLWLEQVNQWQVSSNNQYLINILSHIYTPQINSIVGIKAFDCLLPILVASALIDVMSGLILLIFGIVVSLLPRLNDKWIWLSRQILYSAFLTIILGISVGSIAHKIRFFDPVVRFLSPFQLLDIANPSSNLFLNQFLSPFKLIPPVYPIVLIGSLAFLVALVAIVIRLINGFRISSSTGFRFVIWLILPIILAYLIMISQNWIVGIIPFVSLFLVQSPANWLDKFKCFVIGKESLLEYCKSLLGFGSVLCLLPLIWFQDWFFVSISNWSNFVVLPLITMFYLVFGLLTIGLVLQILIRSFFGFLNTGDTRRLNSNNTFEHWKF